MSTKKLLSTYQLGKALLKNRVVMAPMTRSRATGNIPNDLMAAYYRQRAGAGLIITEGVSPSPNGLGYARIPGAFSQEQTEGWKKVAQAVHAEGGHIFMQFMHSGRIGHARAIASAPDPAALAESIVKHGLSVRQAEQLARKAADRPTRASARGPRPAPSANADVAAIEHDLADALGLAVQLVYNDGKGELRIRYETLDQLDDICQRLTSH